MELIVSQNSKALVLGGALIAIIFGCITFLRKLEGDDQNDQNKSSQIKRRPAGIINQGNTCFVNSLLQAISSVQLFNQNLQSLLKQNQYDQKDPHQMMLVQLRRVIHKINSDSQNIEILTFLQLLQSLPNNLINFQQQDAHQLFSVVTHSIEQAFNSRKSMNLKGSFMSQTEEEVENFLKGYLKSSITCTGCQVQTKIKIDAFYDLSLQIQSIQIKNFNDALQYFQRPQYIENWTCVQCSIKQYIKSLKMNQKQISQNNKQILLPIINDISNYLQHLLIADQQLQHVNQNLSEYVMKFKDVYDQLGQKNADIRRIFKQIEPIRRKIVKKTQITKYPKILVIHFKQLCFNPYSGQPFLLRKKLDFETAFNVSLRSGQRRYSLTSLLTHVGNESMGHYFAYRKATKRDKQWFLISDSFTKSVHESMLKGNIPYMLFYDSQQINKSSHIQCKMVQEMHQ